MGASKMAKKHGNGRRKSREYKDFTIADAVAYCLITAEKIAESAKKQIFEVKKLIKNQGLTYKQMRKCVDEWLKAGWLAMKGKILALTDAGRDNLRPMAARVMAVTRTTPA